MPFILSNIQSAWRSRSPSMRNAGNLLGTTRKFQFALLWRPFSPGSICQDFRRGLGFIARTKRTEAGGFDISAFAGKITRALGTVSRNNHPTSGNGVFSQFGHRNILQPCNGCERENEAAPQEIHALLSAACCFVSARRQFSVKKPRKRSNSLVESLPLMLPAQAK